ncbi:MAG: hypothetical protein KKE20_00100 [Nanoarchaeota archaeon]|nr:hypothetical protein [Nanoarchaeota archaeon]
MEKFWHKLELFIDWIIPYSLVLLFVLVIAELAFHSYVEHYLIYINLADYAIIAIFVADLIFKYFKIRRIPTFLRKYWLDIIAVFPFFLIFRLFEGVILAMGTSQLIKQPQAILHGGIELLEKEGARIVRAAEQAGKVSRTRLLFRFLRPIQRLPRFLKIFPYFEKPTHEHHQVIRAMHKINPKRIIAKKRTNKTKR